MMAAGARLVRFSLIIFVLRCSNTLRRLYDWGYYSGLRRRYRSVHNRDGGGGRIRHLRLTQHLGRESTDLLKIKRAKARHPIRGIEIPRILRQADEIADRGISCPGPAKRRKRQLRRHAGREESLDVRSGPDRFDRRQRRR